MKIVETDRLIIRVISLADADMILELLNQQSFIENISDKGVRTFQQACEFIESGPLAMQKTLGFSMYCCQLKSTAELIGLCGLIKREGVEQPEIGFSFIDKFRGLGLGFEAALAIMNYANTKLAINPLQAIANPNNNVSISLLEKLGFKQLTKIEVPNIEKPVLLFEQEAKPSN